MTSTLIESLREKLDRRAAFARHRHCEVEAMTLDFVIDELDAVLLTLLDASRVEQIEEKTGETRMDLLAALRALVAAIDREGMWPGKDRIEPAMAYAEAAIAKAEAALSTSEATK